MQRLHVEPEVGDDVEGKIGGGKKKKKKNSNMSGRAFKNECSSLGEVLRELLLFSVTLT